jgi:glycosyltransferase involved in cell wall biosynthesis
MLFNKDLSIIIPAYNEEQTLIRVTCNCLKFGNVIVINDCSTDNSIKILKKKNFLNLKIINNNNRSGYDASLFKGIKFALKKRFKYIITFDADNQFYHNDINKFIKFLKKGYQIVVGVRSYKQRFIENFFAFFLNKKYGIKDPFCGFKAYNAKIFKFNKTIFTYNSVGTEILLNYLDNIKTIKQIKIKTKPRLDKPRFGNILTGNYKLLLAIINGYKIIKLKYQ